MKCETNKMIALIALVIIIVLLIIYLVGAVDSIESWIGQRRSGGGQFGPYDEWYLWDTPESYHLAR